MPKRNGDVLLLDHVQDLLGLGNQMLAVKDISALLAGFVQWNLLEPGDPVRRGHREPEDTSIAVDHSGGELRVQSAGGRTKDDAADHFGWPLDIVRWGPIRQRLVQHACDFNRITELRALEDHRSDASL